MEKENDSVTVISENFGKVRQFLADCEQRAKLGEEISPHLRVSLHCMLEILGLVFPEFINLRKRVEKLLAKKQKRIRMFSDEI